MLVDIAYTPVPAPDAHSLVAITQTIIFESNSLTNTSSSRAFVQSQPQTNLAMQTT